MTDLCVCVNVWGVPLRRTTTRIVTTNTNAITAQHRVVRVARPRGLACVKM